MVNRFSSIPGEEVLVRGETCVTCFPLTCVGFWGPFEPLRFSGLSCKLETIFSHYLDPILCSSQRTSEVIFRDTVLKAFHPPHHSSESKAELPLLCLLRAVAMYV